MRASKPKGLNRIAKIDYGHICLREELHMICTVRHASMINSVIEICILPIVSLPTTVNVEGVIYRNQRSVVLFLCYGVTIWKYKVVKRMSKPCLNVISRWYICSSLLPVDCRRVHVLFTLFVFACVKWCPTNIVLWCFFLPCVPYVASYTGLSISGCLICGL